MQTRPTRLRVAIVAASLRILGGQAVQAQRLLDGWRDDPDVEAWLVPINPVPRGFWARLLRIRYVRTLVTQLLYWPLLIREVWRADVVHAFSASYSSFLLAPLPAIVVGRLLRRPVVLNYHSGEAPDHLRRSWVARHVLRRWVDANAVPSAFLRDVFASFGLAATVVPNTIDRSRFAYRVRDPLRPHLLSTRNLEPIYNVAASVRAFARVQARYPDARLTLVGSGSQEAPLRALVAELGLRHVTFTGAVSPADIARHYAEADIYIQSPAIDNMPLSVLEAFSSGLPVVSTNVGGVPSILTHGVHGLLAPHDDDATLAAHVVMLLEAPDYARQLAASAHATCVEYTWPIARAGWLRMYRALAGTTVPGTASTVRRILAMPRAEIAWRLTTAARTAVQRIASLAQRPRWDRHAIRRVLAPSIVDAAMQAALARGDWPAVHARIAERMRARPSRFVIDPHGRDTVRRSVLDLWPGAAADAAERADRMVEGRYNLLGYRSLHVGASDRIDWHADAVHNRQAPRRFWADVPYLDPAVGDHKVIWELNRHQHWLKFGRAYWLTGDERYRDAIVSQLRGWLDANPPLTGINWASMLEIGFRALSWTSALHMLLAGARDSSPDSWLVDMLVAIDRQLTHVEQNLSYYFSPNTHLTGEALALYVVGRALPELAASTRWADTGRRVLLDEIARQVLPDGGHAERSAHYQRYTLDFYLLALATARLTGDEAAMPALTAAASRLATFTRALADDEGRLPLIGDDDGGMLWPITERECIDVRDSLAVAARLLERPELARWGMTEEAAWLLGGGAVAPGAECGVPVRTGTAAPPDLAASHPGISATFPDTGYVVMRDGFGAHAVFDAGAHGYMNGGHAHADALALTLTVGHRPLLVDPGTSTYTMDPQLRDRMRRSVNHNTVTLNGRSSAEPRGPFHWQTRADARLVSSRHNPAFDWAEAVHDAYWPQRLHRVVMRAGSEWLVVDEIGGEGVNAASAHWHVHPEWTLARHAPGRVSAVHLDGDVVWLLHDTPEVWLAHGDDASGVGWFAPEYGTLIPTWTVRTFRQAMSPFDMVTWVAPAAVSHDSSVAAAPPVLERLTPACDTHAAAIAAQVVAGERRSVFLLRRATAAEAAALSGQPIECETADYQTDARALHYVEEDGALVTLNLVGGTRARALRDGWLTVSSVDTIADLHISLAGGILDVRASAPPPDLLLQGDVLRQMRTVLLNTRPLTVSVDDDGSLVLQGTAWGEPHPATHSVGGF